MKRESQQSGETIIEFEDESFQIEENYDDAGEEFEEDLEDEEGSEGGKTGSERQLKVRLDKWLWAARFFKTRALARAAVEAGKISYNDERSKPSREIEIGATLKIRQGRFEKIVIVRGLSTRRRSTEEAFTLFEEQETLPIARTPLSPYGHHPFQKTQFRNDGFERRDPRRERTEHGGYRQDFRQDYRQDNRQDSRNDRDDFGEQRERRGVRFLRRTLVRNTHNGMTNTTPHNTTAQHSRSTSNPYVYQRQTINEVEPVE